VVIAGQLDCHPCGECTLDTFLKVPDFTFGSLTEKEKYRAYGYKYH
jgi:hypothetical protein